LFVRSLHNLKSADTGFRNLDNLVTFQVAPTLNGYDGPRTVFFYRQLLERLRAIPGVHSAGLAMMPLLSGDEWDRTVSVEGYQARDSERTGAFMNALSPDYFRTMGVPLLEGRDFDDRDPKPLALKEEPKVAIVNQSFARHYFGRNSAVGRHTGFGRGPGVKLDTVIVGVAADSLYEGPRQGVRLQMFVPYAGNGSAAFYVRAATGSASLYTAIRNEVKQLDASMPVYRMKTLAGQLDETLLSERLIAMLSAGFGLLATLLAMIGLYGVMAFAVARRTREMGLRMALGAHPGAVVRLVMKEVLGLLALGLAIGVPSAIALGRLVATQLYGIQPGDPLTAAAATALLIAVAATAGLIPALRASRIDPILALRYE
jgi:predicted permease